MIRIAEGVYKIILYVPIEITFLGNPLKRIEDWAYMNGSTLKMGEFHVSHRPFQIYETLEIYAPTIEAAMDATLRFGHDYRLP